MALIRHRETARILLQADSGRFLLMFTHWDPESGLEPRWVSPGGGIEPGEDHAVAASRELLEETGLHVEAQLLGPKLGEITFSQTWSSGDHETGIAHFYRYRVSEEFQIVTSSWTEEEQRDIVDVCWWNPRELKESGEPVGPHGLIELMVELG